MSKEELKEINSKIMFTSKELCIRIKLLTDIVLWRPDESNFKNRKDYLDTLMAWSEDLMAYEETMGI
jgi:hypothetical protein